MVQLQCNGDGSPDQSRYRLPMALEGASNNEAARTARAGTAPKTRPTRRDLGYSMTWAAPGSAPSNPKCAEHAGLQVGSLKVLVVEDEPMVAMAVRTFLQRMGHRVTECFNGEAALEAMSRHSFDLAVVDLWMPEMDGWEVCRRINRIGPEVPVILASGRMVTVEDGLVLNARVKAVLAKPFGCQQLRDAIQLALGAGEQN